MNSFPSPVIRHYLLEETPPLTRSFSSHHWLLSEAQLSPYLSVPWKCCSFSAGTFTENKQPTASRCQNCQMTQAICVGFPPGAGFPNRLAVQACGSNRANLYLNPGGDCSRRLTRWNGGPETEYSHLIHFLNPIALLVKPCKEISPRVGLTSGSNPASPLSREMNILTTRQPAI